MDYGPAHATTRIAHARGGPRRGFSVIRFRNHLDESAQGNSITIFTTFLLWKVTNCSGHPKFSSRRYDRADRTLAFQQPLPRFVLTSPSAAPAARARAAATRDARRDRTLVTSTGWD